MPKIEGILDNSKIQSIGPLFRKENESRWGINIVLVPKQSKKSMTISYAPVLVRRHVLNSTEDESSAGYLLSFTIENTDNWQAKLLSEYPVKGVVGKKEKDELCFNFEVKDGVQIFLPQFELARVLFFQNAYLSRTALEPDCLNAEFDVQNVSPRHAQINILPSSGFPLNLLNDLGSRRLLSWLLLDRDVRTSYESIGQQQKLNGNDKNGWRNWHFKFDPPKLHGIDLEVSGQFEKELKCFFVYEIVAVRNVAAEVPELIDIFHPKFTEKVTGKGAAGGGLLAEPPQDYVVDDVAEAKGDAQPVILSAPPVIFEFAKPFEVRKLAKRKRSAVKGKGKTDEEIGKTDFKLVSVDEGTLAGSLPSAEWDINSDETNDTHLFTNKFACFHNMLDELMKYGWKTESSQLRKLPKIPRCKKHLLSNSDPRCLAVVKLVSQGKSYHILEVDTSDAINQLSTQILRFKFPDKLEEQLKEMEKILLKGSLRWPNNFFIEVCGEEGVRSVPHPKTQLENKGRLELSSTSAWAYRFHKKLLAMSRS